MLGYYNFSLTGTSHIKEGKECQDANCVKRLKNGWIIAVIADGLGSSKHSAVASSSAVKSVLSTISFNIPNKWDENVLISLMNVAFSKANSEIEGIAKQNGETTIDYETTLTAVIYDGKRVVYGHVGDGGIVILDKYGYYHVLTKRLKGEEWNEVVPLSSGSQYWTFGSASAETRDDICSILMATDGILDADILPPILANTSQPVSIEYVCQFMDRNRTPLTTQEDFDVANKTFKEFYEKNQKITDDKTLVVVINADVTPAVVNYEKTDISALVEKQKEKLYSNSTVENNQKISSESKDVAKTQNPVRVVNEKVSSESKVIENTQTHVMEIKDDVSPHRIVSDNNNQSFHAASDSSRHQEEQKINHKKEQDKSKIIISAITILLVIAVALACVFVAPSVLNNPSENTPDENPAQPTYQQTPNIGVMPIDTENVDPVETNNTKEDPVEPTYQPTPDIGTVPIDGEVTNPRGTDNPGINGKKDRPLIPFSEEDNQGDGI